MPKSTDADRAQATRDLHNRVAQIEQPLRMKIRLLETEVEVLKKESLKATFRAADMEAQRNIAVSTLDALIKYLATVKNA